MFRFPGVATSRGGRDENLARSNPSVRREKLLGATMGVSGDSLDSYSDPLFGGVKILTTTFLGPPGIHPPLGGGGSPTPLEDPGRNHRPQGLKKKPGRGSDWEKKEKENSYCLRLHQKANIRDWRDFSTLLTAAGSARANNRSAP